LGRQLLTTEKLTLRFQNYVKGIEHLRPDQQLNLIEIISARLKISLRRKKVEHSIMELEGLGAYICKGVDAQQYVSKERRS
jgi:hypothetical protein